MAVIFVDLFRVIMDEIESNKRENSMLGPQGTGHAQIFAKGLALSSFGGCNIAFATRGARKYLANGSRSRNTSLDFERAASGGSDALFRESKNCSRERSCQNPCQLLKQVFQRGVIPWGATHLPGIFSLHYLMNRSERTWRHP